jgi:chromosome segregation ATPase
MEALHEMQISQESMQNDGEEIFQLREEVGRLTAENEKLRLKDDGSAKVDELKGKLSKKTKAHNKLKIQVEQLKQQLANLRTKETQLVESQGELQTLKNKYDQELAELNDKLEDVVAQKERAEKQNAVLFKKLRNVKVKLLYVTLMVLTLLVFRMVKKPTAN